MSKEFATEVNVKWIKAQSGNTYLCPASAVKGFDNPSEDELRAACVDESANPHNE